LLTPFGTESLGVPKKLSVPNGVSDRSGQQKHAAPRRTKKLSVPNGVSDRSGQQKHAAPRRTKKALRSKWCQQLYQAAKARTAAAAKARTRESLGKKKIASRTRGVGELKFLQRSSALGLYWSGPGSKITARSSLAGFLLLVSLKLTPPGAVSPGFLSQVNKND